MDVVAAVDSDVEKEPASLANKLMAAAAHLAGKATGAVVAEESLGGMGDSVLREAAGVDEPAAEASKLIEVANNHILEFYFERKRCGEQFAIT